MDIQVVQNADGTWRVTNVPLISTGIEYPLMTGPTTFTETQLADAVTAMKEDPAIVEPRIKLGHTSGYNELLVGDAEQAFGRIDASTVYLGDNNQTIYGDYTGLPEWLARVMGMAYPNRSIEGNFDVETVTGRKYELTITAVSLLGVYWPGCQVLEDLPTWYGSEIPDGVEFSNEMAAQLAAGGDGMPAIRKKKIQADADTSKIRRQFYDQAMSGDLQVPDGTNPYWWWIRGERVSDAQGMYLIVEDEDNGELYRVDVTVDGDEITFGEGRAVTVQYPEKTAAARAAVVAGMALADSAVVVHASRADTGGPETTTKGASKKMDDAKRKQLAASCGLPEDASEEQIKARLKQIRAAADDAEAGDELDRKPNEEGADDRVDDPDKEPPAHQTPPGTAPSGTKPTGAEPTGDDDVEAGTVRVDKSVWEQTSADAALARKHENDRIKARQSEKVEAAIKATKIPPARREHYVKLMAADEEGTTQLLESLQAGAVPLRELGGSGGGGDGEMDVNAAKGLPDEWFPELAEKRTRAGAPPVVTMAKEN
jgi:hypothetical protein